MEKKNPIEEAQRYVNNAKDMLFILDAVFHVRKNKKSQPDISDYQKAIVGRDKNHTRF